MASKKIGKELKSPDHFVSFWSKAGTWLGARKKSVLWGVGALAAVIALSWTYDSFRTSRSEHASRDFGRIQKIVAAPLAASPENPGAPPADPDVPRFKTERERLEGALKETDKFLADHGGSSLKDEALLLKARFLVSLDRAADAVPIYTELVGSLDRRLRFLALEGLAYAQEGSGQLDKAVAAFARLADQARESGNFLRDRALYNQARVLERKGAGKDAEKIYRSILSEVPQTSLKEEVNARLAVLEGK